MSNVVWKFKHDRGTETAPLSVSFSVDGSHGVIGQNGVGPAKGFPDAAIDSGGDLKAFNGTAFSDFISGAARPGIDPDPDSVRLTVRKGGLPISSITFQPVLSSPAATELDINALMRAGKASSATPEQLIALGTGLAALDAKAARADTDHALSAQSLADTAQSKVAADNAVANLSVSTTRGKVYGDKAAVDAALGSHLDDDLVENAQTGDIFKRVAGAWQLLTNVGAGYVSARRFGVSPTNTAAQNAMALAAAAAFSAAAGVTIANFEDITTGSTFDPPERTSFECLGWGRIRPSGNFTAIRLSKPFITGKYVADTRAMTDFTESAVIVSGDGRFYDFDRPLDVELEAWGNRLTVRQGVGIDLRSDTGWVSLATLKMKSFGYETPIRYWTNPTLNLDGTPYVGGYINGNEATVSTDFGTYGIVYKHEAGVEISGNRTRGQLQARPDTVHTILTTGTKLLDNLFEVKTWDFKQTYAYNLSPNGIGNIVRDGGQTPLRARISDFDEYHCATVGSLPHKRTAILPASLNNRNFSGNADDSLALSDQDFVVTQTAGPVPAGSLSNAFRELMELRAVYTLSAGQSVTFEVQFDANYASMNMWGLVFDYGWNARRVLLEARVKVGSVDTWVTHLDLTDNFSAFPGWQHPATTGSVAPDRLRVTLADPVDSLGRIALARVWARIGALGGRAYLKRSGGIVRGKTYFKAGLTFGATDTDIEAALNLKLDAQGSIRRKLAPTSATDVWTRLCRIQAVNPIAGNENALFSGRVILGTSTGRTGDRSATVDFAFGVRGAGNAVTVVPLLTTHGNAADWEFRVYRTADGWHDLYFKQGPYQTFALFDTLLYGGTAYWTTTDPTADGTLTQVWSSVGGARQGIEAGHYRVGGVQVVGARAAAIANPTDAATTQAALIALLAVQRAHGLIAP
ncbi:hypothetical protein FNU79_16220 [Deinococcus detaillensis]|uniref:Uncharacterized protein n=1 Tax=Deinococcus detaillensis TaxID=2592048 RepID=A0A553UKQ3_9DEIO|nr:hypothetical protein [Deinococcus detaillensis]TSA80788.1 hypothetical protein FNU79_16220 [Deinococcus detaillensis]